MLGEAREKVEGKLKKLKLVEVSVTATRRTTDAPVPESTFLMYSPFGNKDLVKEIDGVRTTGYVGPFWAVMLADRDSGDLVNMHSYVDTFKFPVPIAEMVPVNAYVKLTVRMPFLVNQYDLDVGDLLVLPFDGGCSAIKSKPPTLKSESGSSRR